MKRVLMIGILLVLAVATLAPVIASASLVGTAFGFPSIAQTGTTTAFNRDTAAATDNEAFALSFPTVVGAAAFPDISQTVAQSQVLTHCDFATTTENAAFSYPFVGVGGACIPGFGFGF